MHFTVIQIIIMFLIGYVCLYALIDRVMKCIELLILNYYDRKFKNI